MSVQVVNRRGESTERPLRVLHIGNTANNAFNIAKLQRRAGIEADVLCVDSYHIMACPEWEDASFAGPIPDHFFPKWHKIDLHGYRRPEWFVQGPARTCLKYLAARNAGRKWRARCYRLKLYIDSRLPWTFFLDDPRVCLEKKVHEWQAWPQIVADRLLAPLKGDRSTSPSLALLQLAVVSVATLVTSIVQLACLPLVAAAALLVMSALSLRRSLKATAAFVHTAPERAIALANRGLQCWATWRGLPERLLPRLAARLNRLLGTTSFDRFRGRAALVAVILPLHTLATLVLSALLVMGLLAATPLFLVALISRRLLQSLRRTGSATPFRSRSAELIALWQRLFPERTPLTHADLQVFEPLFSAYQKMLPHYDIVQGYATNPLWALLAGARPYVAYEHGTLREIPFEETPVGKLTALAYRLSDHTFITNGDCREPARRLGIPRFSATLHGIDDSKFRQNRDLREELRGKYGVSRLYLCPLRADWAVKGSDQYVRALPEIVRRSGTDFRLIMVAWGAMVDATMALARELGVAEQIVWIDPLPKRTLIDWIGAMDCLLDQIKLPHFGATAPEAMGCGVPVISSYEPESTAWIVAEPAPILAAFTPEQIADHLVRLCDPAYHAEISERGLDWFRRHHSSERSLNDHLTIYRELLGTPLSAARAAA